MRTSLCSFFASAGRVYRPMPPSAIAVAAASSVASPPLPVVYHPLYSAPVFPDGHRFPMQVFERIHSRLLSRGIIAPSQVHVPAQPVPTEAQLSLAHCPHYVHAFRSGGMDPAALRRIGFPWSETLVDRTLAEVAGTLLTAELALEHGLACNTAGGTHHAHRDFGSGFCIINDLAVTARALIEQGRVSRVMVVDLDVHQGDGTAAILADEPSVFTLSVHCQDNFPARKSKSDLDVGLPSGTGDDGYLRAVAEVLPGCLQSFRPDLVLFDAGVDTHVSDALGRLEMSDEGLYMREMQVLDTCLGMGVPVAGYVGGGYDADLDVLADRHIHLHVAATEMFGDHRL